jgi:hypothetical protein
MEDPKRKIDRIFGGREQMQLKLKRSQRAAGLMGGKIMFILDARAYPSTDEQTLIKKYNLGSELVYDSEERKQADASNKAHLEAAGAGGSARGAVYHTARGLVGIALAGLKLRITIDSLTKGEHIECKSMGELLGAQNAIVQSCDNLKAYLESAETFDGRESVLEF